MALALHEDGVVLHDWALREVDLRVLEEVVLQRAGAAPLRARDDEVQRELVPARQLYHAHLRVQRTAHVCHGHVQELGQEVVQGRGADGIRLTSRGAAEDAEHVSIPTIQEVAQDGVVHALQVGLVVQAQLPGPARGPVAAPHHAHGLPHQVLHAPFVVGPKGGGQRQHAGRPELQVLLQTSGSGTHQPQPHQPHGSQAKPWPRRARLGTTSDWTQAPQGLAQRTFASGGATDLAERFSKFGLTRPYPQKRHVVSQCHTTESNDKHPLAPPSNPSQAPSDSDGAALSGNAVPHGLRK